MPFTDAREVATLLDSLARNRSCVVGMTGDPGQFLAIHKTADAKMFHWVPCTSVQVARDALALLLQWGRARGPEGDGEYVYIWDPMDDA